MHDLLPYPNINATDAETQAKQINSYLLQLKEAIEFALGSMSDENKSVAEALAKNLAESNATRDDQIVQKVSNGNVVSEINQSAEAILLSGNRVVIDSEKFKLTKDGDIKMLSATIDVQGKVTKKASNYTQADVDSVNKKILGTEATTLGDLDKYDMDGDGNITMTDLVKINRLVQGLDSSCVINTSLKINPLSTQNIIQTDGVSIGVKGIKTASLKSDKAYSDLYYVKTDNGYESGYSGTFKTQSGQTVTVVGGLITQIN